MIYDGVKTSFKGIFVKTIKVKRDLHYDPIEAGVLCVECSRLIDGLDTTMLFGEGKELDALIISNPPNERRVCSPRCFEAQWEGDDGVFLEIGGR